MGAMEPVTTPAHPSSAVPSSPSTTATSGRRGRSTLRHPGPRAPAHRPEPAGPPRGPPHRDVHQRLSGVAARGLRPGPPPGAGDPDRARHPSTCRARTRSWPPPPCAAPRCSTATPTRATTGSWASGTARAPASTGAATPSSTGTSPGPAGMAPSWSSPARTTRRRARPCPTRTTMPSWVHGMPIVYPASTGEFLDARASTPSRSRASRAAGWR